MANQNQAPTGNGCSLEDCFTNLFALTDFSDIQYRKYALKEEKVELDPLEDPLLTAFTKCQEAGLLSAWTRVKRENSDYTKPYEMSNFSKELWVFWYAHTNPYKDLLSGLKEVDNGNWTGGLGYECRTMLFKALHNVVERCLMKKSFVRLGKWFVQPYRKTQDQSIQYSISFSFFLHGESTVCASLDVRQLPPVRYLSAKHLTICNKEQIRLPVILAPYGLAAQLSGIYYSEEDDKMTTKFLNRWLQFYPLKFEELDAGAPRGEYRALPKFVEVIFGGYRMRYPSCFVLISDNDLPESVKELLKDDTSLLLSRSVDPIPPLCAKNIHSYMGERAMERVHQDICTPLKNCDQQFKEEEKPVNPPNLFSYIAPSSRVDCRCRRTMHRTSCSSALSMRRQNATHFHRRNHTQIHNKERLEEVDANCDRNRGPPILPTMPTLSPQPPTLEQQAGLVNSSAAVIAPVSTTSTNQTLSNTSNQTCVSAPGSLSNQYQQSLDPITSSANTPQSFNQHPLANTSCDTPTTVSQSTDVSQQSPPSASNIVTSSAVTTMLFGVEAFASITPHSTISSLKNQLDNCEQSSVHIPSVTPSFPHVNNPTYLDSHSVPPIWPPLGITEIVPDRNHKSSHPFPGFLSECSPSSSNFTRSDPVDSWLGKQLVDLSRGDNKRPTLWQSKIERCSTEPWLDIDSNVDLFNRSCQSEDLSPNVKVPRLHCPKREPFQYHREAYSSNHDEFLPFKTSFAYRGSKGLPPYSKCSSLTPDILDFRSRPETLTGLATKSSRSSIIKPSQSPPDNIFDDEDEDDDTSLLMDTNFCGSQKTGVLNRTPGKIGSSMESSTGSGRIGSAELARMLPTPPSLEQPSPGEQPASCASQPSVVHHHSLTLSHPARDHPISTVCQQPPHVYTLEAYPHSDLVTETYEKDWVHLKPENEVYHFGSKFASSCKLSLTEVPALNFDHRIVKNAYPGGHLGSTNGDCNVSTNPNIPSSHYSCYNATTPGSQYGPKDSKLHLNRQPYTPGGAPVTPGSMSGYPNVASVGSHAGSIEASPAAFPASIQSQRSIHTPADFSPASTPGSVLNRTFGSNIDPSESVHISGGALANHGSSAFNQVNATECLLEAHSLYLNVILSDSMLNVFKDHNFDSCNICECSMSVQGGDVGLYLPGTPVSQEETNRQCNCGFSALMNKRYVEKANLFFEDKEEVTGLPEIRELNSLPSVWRALLPSHETTLTPSNTSSSVTVSSSSTSNNYLPSPSVLSKLYCQLMNVFDEFAVRFLLDWFRHVRTLNAFEAQENSIEYKDACDVCRSALDQARKAMDNDPHAKMDESHLNWSLLHKTFYTKAHARLPDNHNDQIRLLKTVRPWLQEAIGATRLLEACYTVDGPLTWKDFHKLAGRGTDETCEPQPLPFFSIAADREGMIVSPYAIRDWEQLYVKPFSQPKDLAYAVVLPNHDLIVHEMEIYMRELSNTYETCLLGRHKPAFSSPIIRVNTTSPSDSDSHTQLPPSSGFEDWLKHLKGVHTTEEAVRMVQVYMRACLTHVVEVIIEKGVVDMTQFPRRGTSSRSAGGSSLPETGPQLCESVAQCPGNGSGPLSTAMSLVGGENDVYLMIYMINPFTLAADHSELHRLAMQSLVCCSHSISEALPVEWRNRVSFQYLPLSDILNRQSYLARMKSLAFSSYTQTHRHVRPSLINANRTLTAMGPAREKEEISRKHKSIQERRLYTPAYVLAPAKEPRHDIQDRTSVLFCAYCLSEDQHWLLATCTDQRGSLMEYATINITVPDRHRRKKTSPRRIGLAKLWDFLVGVIATTTNPWRLVVKRLGRLGHGELKGWNGLLGRKNLHRVNQQFREQCTVCSHISTLDNLNHVPYHAQEVPSIVSACLVSLELQSTIRVFPGGVKPEERASSGIPLTTPRDASATHILVFPTSTSASAHLDASGNGNIEMDMEFDIVDEDNIAIDLFGLPDDLLPHSSPTGMLAGNMATSGMHMDHCDMNGELEDAPVDPQDEGTYLNQQPLAMGYYISTAVPGPLPSWFWSACPQASRECPCCFKAALHLQLSLMQQEDGGGLGSAANKLAHPLDSAGTCDVLRFVLEASNALSWLTMDPVTNDRRSCLPLHILYLLQLYHAQHAFL